MGREVVFFVIFPKIKSVGDFWSGEKNTSVHRMHRSSRIRHSSVDFNLYKIPSISIKKYSEEH